MNKNLSEKTGNETPKQNTLKVLLQSLKYQLRDLKSVNMNIENLKPELSGGSFQGEKREKGRNSLPEQGENFISHE